MECSARPVNRTLEVGNDMQGMDLYFHSTMQVIHHHIYEYEKGLRDLILHTTKKEFRESAISILEKRDLAYFISPAGEVNINIFCNWSGRPINFSRSKWVFPKRPSY